MQMKVKLGDMFEIGSGGTPSKTHPEYYGGDIPWVKTGDLKSEYLYEVEDFITEEGLNNSSAKVYDTDTVLIAMYGATIGATSILKMSACTNQACAAFKKNEKVIPEYLYYFLKSQKEKFVRDGVGGAQPNISAGYLKKVEMELPSLEEQKVIVEILDKISEIVLKRNQEIQVLDDLIKARFVEMFGSIYDGKFDMKTLSDIVCDDKNSIKRGPFGGALKKDDFVDEGYLVYEQRHAIHNDFRYAKYYITQEKYEDMIGFKVVPGDLIISCSGVTLGRIAEVPEGAKEGIINQALLKLSLNQDVMLNTFFIQQFRGEEIQDILFGFSRGSGIPNMPSMSEVKAVKFICPPLELQKQYCDFVHQVDKLKLQVQKSLDETQLLFDSLMQQYFG